MGILDHSSSKLIKIRHNPVSRNFVYGTAMEKAQFPKTESVLEGEMDMFVFQAVAGTQITKDVLAGGGQDW